MYFVPGSCCIANLSLAVKDDRSLTSQLRGRPPMDPRYLAPEFLERTVDIEIMDFATLKKADMYSFALVLWEIARRCWIQGSCFSLLLCVCVCVCTYMTLCE